MKNITTYINEASNKEGMFMGKTSRRSADDFTFKAGEKVLMLKYDTDGYGVQIRGIYDVKKVNKNSVIISSDDPDYQETIDLLKLKFDKTGIHVMRNKNRYRGNSIMYWVLYNKELIEDENQNDIKQLIDKGTVDWGFRFQYDKEEKMKRLKEKIKEVK